MNQIVQTDQFKAWLTALRDKAGKAHVVRRLLRAEEGHFGDCEPVGEGVSEMRIHIGPGYRVYFARQGRVVYVILCGGDKSSQVRDIKQAKVLWRDIKS